MSTIVRDRTFYQLLSEPLLVPDYQRDYAQGRLNDKRIEDTRQQFVEDILAASKNEKQTHLGLVFGSNNNNLKGFVAVDGQQRLTTCYLFHLYISKRLKINSNPELSARLSNFGWNGRIYASEFSEFLISANWNIQTNKYAPLSELLKQSVDYFTVWEKDPTVNNMLVILDEIHRKMWQLNENSLKLIEANLVSDTCRLNFDYMKLQENTDEFQYQKMNSRGRDLTTYELFKQKLISEGNVSESVKDKLDNKWLIFFDELATNNGADPDVFMQNYINETALWLGVKYSGGSFAFVSQIVNSKLKDTRTDVAFVGFDAYYDFCNHLPDVEQLFDWIVDNYDLVDKCTELYWYIGEKTRLIDIFNESGYQVRAVNYAIFHYANKNSYQPLDEENFKLWWRPIHNLIANTDIDNSNFANIIKAIDGLPVTDIYGFLKASALSGFSEYQREEERRKAVMCKASSQMTELFYIQEKRKRFHGQIGLLLPDENEANNYEWNNIIAAYEELAGEKYIDRDSSDFDFITAMLTFVGKDFNHDSVNGLKLKYESGHLRGLKIPARWIHRMIFQYIEDGKNEMSITPQVFFKKCRDEWMESYSKLSYEDKKNNAWIAYILGNYDECEKLFLDSDYGKLTKKDGNLWLYLKTNRNERDILLSNKRKEVIEGLSDLIFQWKSDHDIVTSYSDIPFLRVVFASNVIWVGIPRDSDVKVPSLLPEYIKSTDWYQAWAWFSSDEFDLNNFYESNKETLDHYIESLSQNLRNFCEKFVSDVGLNMED